MASIFSFILLGGLYLFSVMALRDTSPFISLLISGVALAHLYFRGIRPHLSRLLSTANHNSATEAVRAWCERGDEIIKSDAGGAP